MVDSENSSDNCKTYKISIGEIIRNPKMLQIVPDHLKTKKICRNVVKKLPFIMIMYVPDLYKTNEMYDKVILGKGGILKFIPDCYKN